MRYEKVIDFDSVKGLYQDCLEYDLRIQKTNDNRLAISLVGRHDNVIWFSVVTDRGMGFRMEFETGHFDKITSYEQE